MTPDEFQEKKQTFIDIMTSLIIQEFDEAVAHEMSTDIEGFATDALSCYIKDGYVDEPEGDGMIEYHADMDAFSSPEE